MKIQLGTGTSILIALAGMLPAPAAIAYQDYPEIKLCPQGLTREQIIYEGKADRAKKVYFCDSSRANAFNSAGSNSAGPNPGSGKIRIHLRAFGPWRLFGNFTDTAGFREAGRAGTVLSWGGLAYGNGLVQLLGNTLDALNSEDWAYHGDDRGFSPNPAATGRTLAFVDVPLNNLQGSFQTVDGGSFADPSVGSFYWGVGSSTTRTADTVAKVKTLVQSQTRKKFRLKFQASNPFVPVVSPTIDWALVVDIRKKAVSSQPVIDITTSLSGDGFPAVEVFVTDSGGKSVFLRGYQVANKRGLHKLTFSYLDWALEESSACADYFSRKISNTCQYIEDWFAEESTTVRSGLPKGKTCGDCRRSGTRGTTEIKGVSSNGVDDDPGTYCIEDLGSNNWFVTKIGESTTRIELDSNNKFTLAGVLRNNQYVSGHPKPPSTVSGGSMTIMGTINQKVACTIKPALDCGQNATGGWSNGSCKTNGCQ